MILRGTFFSTTLEMETGCAILVPNRVLTRKDHKVAYLLHGLCGRSGDWLDYTQLPVYAEEYNVVFVMPEVARSFYTDMVFGQKFFSFVADELPTVVKSVFRVSQDREDTMVLGASMGGYGALKCAFSHPERYGACGAFSPACLFLKEGLERQRFHGKTEAMEKRYGKRLLNDFEAIFGSELAWRPEDDILELAKGIPQGTGGPKCYVACGAEDFLRDEVRRFAGEMALRHLDFRYQEWPGVHDWRFFNSALEQALQILLGAAEVPETASENR